MRAAFRQIVCIGFALAATVGSAAAQTSLAEPPSGRTIQIGGSVEGFIVGTPEGEGWATAMANLRVTAPFARRFALESFISIPRRQYESYFGVYGIQVKQRLVGLSRRQTEVFATYGAMGIYDHSPAHDYQFSTYGGRVERYREPSHTEISLPLFALIGVGVEQRVAHRLAVRFETQGFVYVIYPVGGARLLAGVSVPVGRVARD